MVDNAKSGDETRLPAGMKGTAIVGWARVKELLHKILVAWQEANDDTPPSLRHVHGNDFIGDHPYLGWETKDELSQATAQVRDDPARYRLIEPASLGPAPIWCRHLLPACKSPMERITQECQMADPICTTTKFEKSSIGSTAECQIEICRSLSFPFSSFS